MIATVQHISRDRVHIKPAKGFEVAIFTMPGGEIEALVTALDGSESARLKVEAPPPGRKARIKDNDDGSFDVIYQDIEENHS